MACDCKPIAVAKYVHPTQFSLPAYEAQDFLPKRVVKLKSTYALASEPLTEFPGWWDRCLIWETARPYLYLRTTSDSRAFVGREDDPFRNPTRRDNLVRKRTDQLAIRFGEMFPAIDLEVAYRWQAHSAKRRAVSLVSVKSGRCRAVILLSASEATESHSASLLQKSSAILSRGARLRTRICFDLIGDAVAIVVTNSPTTRIRKPLVRARRLGARSRFALCE